MRVYLFAAALLVLTLACGKEQEAALQPFSGENVLIALDPTTASLSLIDLSSGQTLARLTAGPSPHVWAAYRSSAGELLVSDLEVPSYRARLRVFDAHESDAPKWTIPMPDRVIGHSYAPAMALSEDERYLYYSVRDPEETYPSWIVIVDLVARREIARAELPAGCGGYKTLEAGKSSSAQVFCPPNRLVTVDPTGGMSELMQLELPLDGTADGCLGPGDTIPCRLGDERRLLAQRRPHTDFLTRLLVYSEDDPQEAQRFDLPDGIVHFTPIDSSTVALLEANTGTIYLFDLTSARVTGELQAPPGTRWLVGP